MTTPAHHLRPAIPEDLDALYALHRAGIRGYVEATFGPWSDEEQRAGFDARYAGPAPPGLSLEVLVVGDEVAGYLHCEQEPGQMRLANVRVAPAWQGRGLGEALVRGVIAAAAPLPVVLRVLRVNPARALYERLGFAIVEETPTHYAMRRP